MLPVCGEVRKTKRSYGEWDSSNGRLTSFNSIGPENDGDQCWDRYPLRYVKKQASENGDQDSAGDADKILPQVHRFA